MAKRIVIPARYASTRLPGKLLIDLAGKPMLQHVFERAQAAGFDSVMIATDDEKIVKAAEGFGAEVMLTDASHQSGTDRAAEVMQTQGYAPDDIIVVVQGDEPMMPTANIQQVAENLAQNPEAAVATLCEHIDDIDLIHNPHCVKVVSDKHSMALYFSRAAIPWARGAFPTVRPEDLQSFMHIGMYAYRGEFLQHYSELESSPLEKWEALEQLRVLWHGYKIHVAEAAEHSPPGVDTEAGLALVRGLMRS